MPNITVYSYGNFEDFGIWANPQAIVGQNPVTPPRYNSDAEVWFPKILPPSGRGLGIFKRIRLRFAWEGGVLGTVTIRVYKAGTLPNDNDTPNDKRGNPYFTATYNNFAGGTWLVQLSPVVSESIAVVVTWNAPTGTSRYSYNSDRFLLTEERRFATKLVSLEVDAEDYGIPEFVEAGDA